MVGAPIATGKSVGGKINHSLNIVQSKHHFKKPEIESTGVFVSALFWFFFVCLFLNLNYSGCFLAWLERQVCYMFLF